MRKRPRTSYLEPSSELLQAEYSMLRKVLPIGLLRNGNLLDLKPIKISKNMSVTLSNTCGFDSLIQLMATSYCDSFAFKFLIDLLETKSETAAIILNLIKEGVSKKKHIRKEHYYYNEFLKQNSILVVFID